jgi:7,8-dihydropterin-6-yl-methyl-4-(beta-D-ribofuranosyl)aminobenzene 5'-phosphate synthase
MIEGLRIVTLSENTSTGRGLLGEWGLSILLDTGDRCVLLDTGSSHSIAQNIETLSVDPRRIDTIVLSHGHGDHTGGLRTVLSRIRKKSVKVIAHPDVWGAKYSKKKDTGEIRFGGIPFQRHELESLGAEFHLSSEPTWINEDEDIVASGEEPMTTDFESVPDTLLLKEGDRFVQDPMRDDQSLFLRTKRGLVIVLGCAHRGMINIIRYARELTGVEEVHMVLGGTHLGFAPPSQVERTIVELKDLGVQKLGVSHCTGLSVASRLSTEFGDNFFFNNTGTTLNLS